MAGIETNQEFWISLTERGTQMETLMAWSDATKKLLRLNDPAAAAFLGVSHSTLAHARAEWANTKSPKDPNVIGAIRYFPGPPVEYRLYDLLIYKMNQEPVAGVTNKRSAETKAKTAATVRANNEQREKSRAALRMQAQSKMRLGFVTYMQTASATDTWPFSIQSDGRPMDLYAAILDQKLTGQSERLTLREFAERIADAASKAYSDGERDVLEGPLSLAQSPEDGCARTNPRKKTGGPL